MESHIQSGWGIWAVPQCPFTIQYSPRVLDDIRLAVVDAFFSLPRGGAEIGGVLLGSYQDGQLKIADYEPLECEHAFGPGFTLSDRDKRKLADMLAAERPEDVQVVGWYHSHTRSEIFLSDADVEIHQTYFPQPWQVALVIKPHTFQPARAGFFFRESGGRIQSSASYREVYLQPLTVRPLPSGRPPGAKEERPFPVQEAPGRVGKQDGSEPDSRVVTVPVEAIAEPAASGEPAVGAADAADLETVGSSAAATPVEREKAEELPLPREPEIPAFMRTSRQPSRLWLKALIAIAAGAAIGLAGYGTRQAWLPQVLAGFERITGGSSSAATTQLAAMDLNVIDNNGQLQIRWDRNSAALRNAANALLEIVDTGAAPRAIPLDEAHLRSGSFTYAREGERVDVALSMDQPNGKRARESTTFLGRMPSVPDDSSGSRRQRDDGTRQNAKLENDLKNALDRNNALEKSLEEANRRLRDQQRQRMANQAVK